jgi:hypothetical protein
MGRTDTAVRISASPDRVFAALTDPDALARARLARPKRDTGRHFRSDTQCERLARRPSRAWFGRDAVVRAETELAPAFGGGPLCAHTGYVRELANQITKTRP